MESFETVETSNVKVSCDAGLGALGHPRVYLRINRASGDVTCPYCSRHFVYRPESVAATDS